MVGVFSYRYYFCHIEDANDANVQVLHDVSIVLTGFFKFGLLPASGAGKLHIYNDGG